MLNALTRSISEKSYTYIQDLPLLCVGYLEAFWGWEVGEKSNWLNLKWSEFSSANVGVFIWAAVTEYHARWLIVWEVMGQGAGRFSVWRGPDSWFLDGVFFLCPHTVERARELAGACLLYQGSRSVQEVSVLVTYSPPKASPPTTIPLEVRISTQYENIQPRVVNT